MRLPLPLLPGHRTTPGLPLPDQVADAVADRARAVTAATDDDRLGDGYRRLMLDAWRRTLSPGEHGVFVVTGDIPAMWLRDSSLQMRPWVPLAASSDEVAAMVAGVVATQWRMVLRDPRANAFTNGPGPTRHVLDVHAPARRDPWVWERKYEVDSLALPVLLAADLAGATGSSTHLDEVVHRGFHEVVGLWELEQHHEHSPYRFVRLDAVARRRWHDTLPRRGRGTPVGYTGMTWQGFRPSDDACTFGYNVPAQLVAARALRLGAGWCEGLWDDPALAGRAVALADAITAGVERFGLLDDGTWAYEVDGLGGRLAADDANLPSLLGLPLLADVGRDDERYLACRERILSLANPWWCSGSAASGIGSAHTPPGHVWPIAIAVQGLTSTSDDERLRLARLLAATTAGTGRVHESFHADDPSRFTRAWFGWADMMFCELAASLT